MNNNTEKDWGGRVSRSKKGSGGAFLRGEAPKEPFGGREPADRTAKRLDGAGPRAKICFESVSENSRSHFAQGESEKTKRTLLFL